MENNLPRGLAPSTIRKKAPCPFISRCSWRSSGARNQLVGFRFAATFGPWPLLPVRRLARLPYRPAAALFRKFRRSIPFPDDSSLMGTSINSFFGQTASLGGTRNPHVPKYVPVAAFRPPSTSSRKSEFLEAPSWSCAPLCPFLQNQDVKPRYSFNSRAGSWLISSSTS